jgi:hypothetical protein
MRRTLALLLPVLLSLPLIAPLILANADSNLPACCRRNGQHHCAMPSMGAEAPSSSGSSIHSGVSRCSYYPGAASTQRESKIAPLKASLAIFASLISHPVVQTQTEAQYRVSFSRSRHKRGPPALLS